MIIDYYGLSEIGPVREDNQDTIRLPDRSSNSQPGTLFGIADGMGGYSHGGLASSLALEALYSVYHQAANPQKMPRILQRGVEAANLAVVNEARRQAIQKMGTTLTALALDPMSGRGGKNQLHLAHVGDSRAYLVRKKKVTCLTNDHTVVGDLLRMRVLTPDQVRTHARRSVLTRAVGLALFVQPEFTSIELHEDDRLILCTDGLWAAVPDEEFERIAQNENNMERMCKNAIELALENDSDDNLSVISIHIQSLDQVSNNGKSQKSWLQRIFSNGKTNHHGD